MGSYGTVYLVLVGASVRPVVAGDTVACPLHPAVQIVIGVRVGM